jgi:hypothetical protein
MRAQLGFRLGIFLVLLLPPIVLGRQNSPVPIPNSPKGFDKQYKSAFNAYEKVVNKEPESEKTFAKGDGYEKVLSVYTWVFRKKSASKKAFRKGDEQDPMERFRTFAIPERWFNDVFGPDRGPELAREYQELFKGFEYATAREFTTLAAHDCGDCVGAWVETKVWGTNTLLKSARSAPTSLVPLPPVQRFRIRYYVRFPDKYDYSRVDTFIYVDGAFRFIGGGACPFWATPCSPNLPLWLRNWGFTSD